MRMCMDEVHFEHGGREVHMRKRLPSVSNPHLVSYGGLQRALAMLSRFTEMTEFLQQKKSL